MRALARLRLLRDYLLEGLLRLRELALAEVEAAEQEPRTRVQHARLLGLLEGALRLGESPLALVDLEEQLDRAGQRRRRLERAQHVLLGPFQVSARRAHPGAQHQLARARAAGFDLGVETRERELRAPRRELELDQRLQQPLIPRRALLCGQQRRVRRLEAGGAFAPRVLERGIRRRIRLRDHLLEHGTPGVAIAELVEGVGAAQVVARREALAAAREHAIGAQHLGPVLRVEVDARFEPVELERARGERNGPLDRGDGGGQIAESLLGDGEHPQALRALVALRQLAQDLGAFGDLALGECDPSLGCPGRRIVGEVIGHLVEAVARLIDLVVAELEVDQLSPQDGGGGLALERALQMRDGVRRPLLAQQVVRVQPVAAGIVPAPRDQLAADLLAARDRLAVREDHEILPGLVILRVRLHHLAQGLAPQGEVALAPRMVVEGLGGEDPRLRVRDPFRGLDRGRDAPPAPARGVPARPRARARTRSVRAHRPWRRRRLARRRRGRPDTARAGRAFPPADA